MCLTTLYPMATRFWPQPPADERLSGPGATVTLAPAVLDDFLAFAAAFGIVLYPWQAEAFGAACRREAGRFVHRIAAVSVPRGNGKSYAGAGVDRPNPNLVPRAAQRTAALIRERRQRRDV
jgi:hypothetical protein